MSRILISGIGTEVGKTVVSAIWALRLGADYWKPIQCGHEDDADTAAVKRWLDPKQHTLHPPAYSFKAPLSPHHAARLENRSILCNNVTPPTTQRPLIIEGVGGIFVPLTEKMLTIDLFQSWNCSWIIVSKHYLGSINHTLLTIEALQQRHITLLGIIFNGEPNPDSENVILAHTQIPFLGRLLPERHLNKDILQRYANQWKIQEGIAKLGGL